jgi:hypothetical protein
MEDIKMKKAIVKKYSEFTQDEKRQHEEIWVKHLNTICQANSLGNRPCDNGKMCDICTFNYSLQKNFAMELIEIGAPITHNQSEYVSDEYLN